MNKAMQTTTVKDNAMDSNSPATREVPTVAAEGISKASTTKVAKVLSEVGEGL